MSSFLDNLKESLDTGNFNSESAANITKIVDKSAEKINNLEQIKEKLTEIQNNLPAVDEAIANSKNSTYEAEMKRLQDADAALFRAAQAFQMDENIMSELAEIELARANIAKMSKDILKYIDSLSVDLDGDACEFKAPLLEIRDKYEKMF